MNTSLIKGGWFNHESGNTLIFQWGDCLKFTEFEMAPLPDLWIQKDQSVINFYHTSITLSLLESELWRIDKFIITWHKQLIYYLKMNCVTGNAVEKHWHVEDMSQQYFQLNFIKSISQTPSNQHSPHSQSHLPPSLIFIHSSPPSCFNTQLCLLCLVRFFLSLFKGSNTYHL
jgi:hypothetical protein